MNNKIVEKLTGAEPFDEDGTPHGNLGNIEVPAYPTPEFDFRSWRVTNELSVREVAQALECSPVGAGGLDRGSRRPVDGWEGLIDYLRSVFFIPHIEDNPDNDKHPCVYRATCTIEVRKTEQVGKRGGRRIPVCVRWRTHGTGLFALGKMIDVERQGRPGSVPKVDSVWHYALYPEVQWHNGDGKMRYTPVNEWRAFARKLKREQGGA